jgi:hypothetical protein
MRAMKARSMARKRGETPPPASTEPEGERAPELDEETAEEAMEEGMLVDQGDGMHVVRRSVRRGPDDRDSHECPDEPPEGWGEG